MPEDILHSFKFIKSNGERGDEGDMINDAIARYLETEFSLSESRAKTPVDTGRDADWDGNVPPEFGDGFEFML